MQHTGVTLRRLTVGVYYPKTLVMLDGERYGKDEVTLLGEKDISIL